MLLLFFFQAEDGIRDLVRSRGLGDVYKRQQHQVLRTGDFKIVLAEQDVFAFQRHLDGATAVVLSLIHI